ncbi:MAG: hypothetical protein Q8L97_01375 [Nitrosomonas sp.]|uniref:hypothetical protein n=1 Tax=Nitrosomonas sp. TaxID=42353 RepID=UPI002731C9C8|nr:hypothetical protein [Nitrosomonas sp.]MDP1548799.1 hypothetical protein [Nitrosomonas sp.]
MMNKEFFVKNSKLKESNDDEDEALADGLIPDSRIVQIIDELETNHDELDNDEDPEIKLKSLGLHSSRENLHRLAE